MADIDVASIISKECRVTLRQRLPLKMIAVVEKCLGNGRLLISNSESKFNLEILQHVILEAVDKAKEAKLSLVEATKESVKTGDIWLLKEQNDMQMYRVRILSTVDTYATCRFIDFGLCHTIAFNALCRLPETIANDYPQIASSPPFVTRVNLPNDELLHSMNLPTSQMIKEGDFVEATILTTTEPHLAVFGLTQSFIYRPLPNNITSGFNEEETQNWLSLFGNEQSCGASLIPDGFGQLHGREFHVNRLAFIAHVSSLDKIYVHDLESMIRLPMLRERLEILYGNENGRKQYFVSEPISTGDGCVAYDERSKTHVRCEVISAGEKKIDLSPIDQPNLGNFAVCKDQIFKVPKSLQFPRQAFVVRATREYTNHIRQCLSSMARCLLPSGTPVVLNSETRFGLVKITSASAPKGVLSKIGFYQLNQLKFESESMISKTFGSKLAAPEIESIEVFAKRLVNTKQQPKPLKSALKKTGGKN